MMSALKGKTKMDDMTTIWNIGRGQRDTTKTGCFEFVTYSSLRDLDFGMGKSSDAAATDERLVTVDDDLGKGDVLKVTLIIPAT